MSTTHAPPSDGTLRLEHRFADALPELALAWQAEDAPQARLVTLNEPLAAELGLDVDHLRSPEGLRLLTGNAVPEGATPVAQAYAGTSSVGGPPVSATGGPCCSASSAVPTGTSATCTSRGPGAPPSRAEVTASPRSARCCAST